MTNVSIPEVNMLKNSSRLAVCVPINISIKLDFVFANGHRETYFVDELVLSSKRVNNKTISSKVNLETIFMFCCYMLWRKYCEH